MKSFPYPNYLCFFWEGNIIFQSGSGHLPTVIEIKEIIKKLQTIKKKGSKYINNHNAEIDKQLYEEMTKVTVKKPKKKSGYGYLYLIKCGGLHKIGVTKKNPEVRLKTYRTENPHEVNILFCKKIMNYKETEEMIKNRFQNKLKKGAEWFKFSQKNIDWIKDMI